MKLNYPTFLFVVGSALFSHTIQAVNYAEVDRPPETMLPIELHEQSKKDALVNVVVTTVRAIIKEVMDESDKNPAKSTTRLQFKSELRVKYEENKMQFSRYKALNSTEYDNEKPGVCISLGSSNPVDFYREFDAS